VQAYRGGALAALADPTRRAIFEAVATKPRCVADLAVLVPVSRPAVSQHLDVLRRAHLVRSRPEGTKRIYAVDPAGLAEVRQYFEQFWTDALAAFKDAVEQEKS
jgi:DNA-binding transcriptional ArsR family regulator